MVFLVNYVFHSVFSNVHNEVCFLRMRVCWVPCVLLGFLFLCCLKKVPNIAQYFMCIYLFIISSVLGLRAVPSCIIYA